jgi:hypothetical protein
MFGPLLRYLVLLDLSGMRSVFINYQLSFINYYGDIINDN